MRDSGDRMLGVDPSALRAAVPGLTDLATALDATLTRLRGELADAGPCWGHDDPGATFERGYLPAGEQAEQAFRHLAAAIETIGADLTAVAERSAATDEQARARFQ